MKRWISGILAAALLLCLAACGQKQEAAEETRLIRVGFSQVGSESSWRLANTASMESALSEENGFELLTDNARQNQANQLLAIRNFIQQGVDYIVLAPVVETGWDSVLEEAKNAGIPVIIVDRQVQVKDDSLYAVWVGSDFYKEGRNAVQWLEYELSLQDRQGEKIRILHLQGTEGATSQIFRTKAVRSAVAAHPNWETAAVLDGDYTEAKAYEAVKAFLAEGGDMNVLYSENDNMTFGALRAMDEAGITHGPGGQVTVISFDAVKTALEACKAGEINLCVECNPLHGPRVAKIIRALETGDSLEKLQYVDETWYSAQQLADADLSGRAY